VCVWEFKDMIAQWNGNAAGKLDLALHFIIDP